MPIPHLILKVFANRIQIAKQHLNGHIFKTQPKVFAKLLTHILQLCTDFKKPKHTQSIFSQCLVDAKVLEDFLIKDLTVTLSYFLICGDFGII